MDAISEGPKRGPAAVAAPRPAALEREKGKSVVDGEKCIGCGICVVSCLTDAIRMEPVSEEEWFQVPSSFQEWEERRLEFLEAAKDKK